MYVIESILLVLLFSVVAVPFSNVIRLPLEVCLLVGGCIVGILLRVPHFEINPVVVFNLFLPVILFYAAYFSLLVEFELYKSVIFLLSVVLVIFTMTVVAIVTKLVMPAFSWPECFILGGIISPTDASAATSIIKKLNAPQYLITILEAESLLNDATALILLRFALVSSAMVSYAFSDTIIDFLVVSAGGALLGMVLGFVSLMLLLRLQSSVAATTLTFITAIGTYIAGEHVGVSGVIATVTAGIYFGIKLPELNSSGSRVQGRASWDTLIFIINCLAFMLIGLELPVIVRDMPAGSSTNLVIGALVVSITVMLVRLLWIFMTCGLSSWLNTIRHTASYVPSRMLQFLLGWCGMRGIVSLAAVLSIPALLPHGAEIPHLKSILFITYIVITATLIIPSITLPYLVVKFKLSDKENKQRQEAEARLLTLQLVEKEITKAGKNNQYHAALVTNFQHRVNAKIKILTEQLQSGEFVIEDKDYRELQSMTLATIQDERNIILALRKSGKITGEIFNTFLEELDREELRAQTLRLP